MVKSGAMALPEYSDYTSRHDLLITLCKQRNACPICHLPLCFDMYDGDAQSPDYWWSQMRRHMKATVPANQRQSATYLFGDDKNNIQYCHLVSHITNPELSPPLLYTVPSANEDFHPEQNHYIMHTSGRASGQHKLLNRWDFAALCPHQDQAKLSKLYQMLSFTGTHYFLACHNCNLYHTGHDQLTWAFNEIYRVQPTDPEYPIVNKMYTMIFDSMAEYTAASPPYIAIDDSRRQWWSVEIWLDYCVFMMLAQETRCHNGNQVTKNDICSHGFRFSHRDIGLLDFYISQMIATVLYANFDIEVDFITLHQNFLCLLPRWAMENGRFRTPTTSLMSLTSLVLGELGPDGPGPLCVKLDMGTNRNQSDYEVRSNQFYYLWSMNSRDLARFVQTRFIEFAEHWIMPLGAAVCSQSVHGGTHPLMQGYDHPTQAHCQSLRAFFMVRCDDIMLHKITSIPSTMGNAGGVPMTGAVFILTYPKIKTFSELIALQIQPYPKSFMFENMLLITMERMDVFQPKQPNVRQTWRRVLHCFDQLIQTL